MIQTRYYILVICMLSFVFSAQAQSKDTLRVLFVGNSYTYFWNLPQTVQTMASADKAVVLIARQSTAGGTTWKQHWEGDKGLESRKHITEGTWDFVVLQNHSLSTLDNLDQFMEYGGKFINLVKAQGATPILYMTWARAHNPLMQSKISEGYRALGEKHGVEVVPIGEIWEKSRQLRPNLTLYDPDGSHPSTIGTYLTACAFYSFFMEKPATGLPKRIITTDADGEVLYLSIMSEENAEFLQNVVDSVLSEMNDE